MKLLHNRAVVIAILAFIVVLAGILRFYKLGDVPVSLYWDEIADAYNAYSISQTLHDEHNHFLPLLFQSFDDYKMPAMVYLMALSIKVLGLTEFATRLPMALLGVATVLGTYFLVKELLAFRTKHTSHVRLGHHELIALTSSFLLAISPWHIQFSRTGYEATGAVACIVFGMLFFFRALRHVPWIYLSVVFFALSFYFYRNAFVFVPLLIISCAVIFYPQIRTQFSIQKIIFAVVLFVLLVVPITYRVFTPPGNSRASEVSVFTNSTEKISRFQMLAIQSGNGFIGNYVYNKRLVFTREIINNYSVHFSPQFLFLDGDGNERHSVRDMGVLYLWEAPFMLLGLFALFKLFPRRSGLLILSWLLLGPLPAAISIFAPHALRSLNMLPMPQILVATGIVFALITVHRIFRPFGVAFIGVCMVFFFVSYIFKYYTTDIFLSASAWGEGYKEMNMYVKEHEKEYERVLISGHYWQPYVYTLFYTKYDPVVFQKLGSSREFGKYVFGGTSWETHGHKELGDEDLYKLSDNKRSLVVLTPKEWERQKAQINYLTDIKGLAGNTIFMIGVLPSQKTQ